jgi:hypothetical protein
MGDVENLAFDCGRLTGFPRIQGRKRAALLRLEPGFGGGYCSGSKSERSCAAQEGGEAEIGAVSQLTHRPYRHGSRSIGQNKPRRSGVCP